MEKFEQQELTALKKARDGVTILIPQPSNDPNDPLNWSRRKKWSIMAIVAYCAAMPDMQAGFGIPLVVPQAIYWDISITDSGRSMSGNVFVRTCVPMHLDATYWLTCSDDWYRESHRRPCRPTIWPTSHSFLVHVSIVLDDSWCDLGQQPHRVYCSAMLANHLFSRTPSHWAVFRARHVSVIGPLVVSVD